MGIVEWLLVAAIFGLFSIFMALLRIEKLLDRMESHLEFANGETGLVQNRLDEIMSATAAAAGYAEEINDRQKKAEIGRFDQP